MRQDFIRRGIVGLAAIFLIGLAGCGSGQTSKNPQGEVPFDTATSATNTTSKLIKISGHVDTGTADGSLLNEAGILVTAYRIDMAPQLKKGLKKTVQISDGVYQTTTDSTGYYELDIPPADYTIVVEGPSHKKAMKTLAAEATAISLDFVLTATGDITGRIVQSGNPLNATDVYVPGTSFIAKTDGDGNFNLSDVPVGIYLISLAGILQSVTLVAGTLDIGTIDIDGIPPQVTYTYPANGGMTTRLFSSNSYSYYGEGGIVIGFSQWMNEETLRNAVTITTPNNVPINWNISTSSYDSWGVPEGWNRLYIYPASTEEYNRLPLGVYTVTISAAATAINGKTLDRDYTFTFTLEDRIIWTSPENGSKDVSMEIENFPIEVGFSNTMNRDSVKLSIDPPVPEMIVGWNREDGWSASFDRAWIYGSFAQNTHYTVTITDGVTSAGEHLAGLPYSFSFTTVEPKVVWTTPADGATDVPGNNQVSMTFNTVMDRDSVEKGLTVKEGNNPVSNVKVRWDNGDNGYYEGWRGSDNLLLDFPKTFGKIYTISVTGARTSQGTPIADHTFSFTTLVPRIVSTYPSNGDVDPLFGPIEIRPNVPLDLSTANKANIRVIDQDNNPVDIDISFNSFNDYASSTIANIYVDPRNLKSSTLYTVFIQGLKSADGIALPDYQFTFQTPSRFIEWDYPWHGQTNVDWGQHFVEASINDPLTAEEKAAIEAAIVVTARTYNDNQGITETHPTPQFLWADENNGYSRLYISFTFDEGTNYRIWTRDGNGNPTQEIRDSNGNPVLFVDNYLEFSTQSAASMVAGKPNLVYEVTPRDGSLRLDPINTQIKVVFGTVVLEAGLDINVYEDGILLPGDAYSIQLGTEWRYPCYSSPYGGQTCDSRLVSVANLSITNFGYNKSYKIEVVSALPDTSGWYYRETSNNLPFASSFTTGGTRLYLSVDNTRGRIYVESGSPLMDGAALQSAFGTTPQVSCNWEMDGLFSSWAVCNYNPIQYANIRVDIAALTAYERNPNTGEVIGIGTFENTPLSEVFTVNPDVTLPVLDSAGVSENLPGDHAILLLNFNTFLDRDSVLANGAFSITDSNGGTLSINNVDPGPNRWADSTIRLTTAPLTPGLTYTLVVTGVKELGGRYTIDSATAGTKTFTFNGQVVKVSGISGYYDYDGDGQSQWIKKFAVTFNAPMKEDDIDYAIADKIVLENQWCTACSPFMGINYQWNPGLETLIITGIFDENAQSDLYFNVTVLNTVLNSAGNPLENTPYRVSVYNQDAHLNIAWPDIRPLSTTQLEINLWSSSAVDTTANNALNYALKDSNGNALNVIGASLNSNGTVITLDLDPATPMVNSSNYRLSISNVRRLNIDFPADYLGVVLDNHGFWVSGL